MNKNIRISVLVLALLYLLAGNLLATPLQQLSGYNAEIRSLVMSDVDSGLLWAGTYGGGLFKSTDGGTTWIKVQAPFNFIKATAQKPSDTSVIYVGTIKGLFRSVDSGNSWIRMTYDPVDAVSINPDDTSNIAIGIRGAGILMSFDGGTTWENRSQGLDALDITKILFDPVTPSKMYVTVKGNTSMNNGGVFVSTNLGLSWSPFSAGLNEKTAMDIVVHPDGTLNLGTAQSLYRRAPGATSWTQTKWIGGVQTIIIDKTNENILYAGSQRFGLFRSIDKGLSWQNFGNAVEDTIYSTIYQILSFAGNPDKLMVALSGRGLFITVNGGVNWTQITNGIQADRVMSLSISPSTGVLLAGLQGGGAMRSTDGGNNWSPVNSGLLLEGFPLYLTVNGLSISTDGNTVYAATEIRGLYRSTDGGINWSRVTETGLPSDPTQYYRNNSVAVDPLNSNSVYAGYFESGIYKRAETSWSHIFQGTENGYGVRDIFIGPSEPNKIFALQYYRMAEISVDAGASWQPFTAPHDGFMNLGFFTLSENPFDPDILLGSTNKGLYQSYDSGFTWSSLNISSGLESTLLSGIAYSSSTSALVFAGDKDGKLYCSNNGGLNWQKITDPLLRTPVKNVVFNNGILYILTDGSGILKDLTPSCPDTNGIISGTVYFRGIECHPLNMKVPPCEGPYPDYEVVVYNQSGTTVIDRAFTDENGQYSFSLPPTTYVIYSKSIDANMNPINIPHTIQLNPGQNITFDINIDTGMR